MEEKGRDIICLLTVNVTLLTWEELIKLARLQPLRQQDKICCQDLDLLAHCHVPMWMCCGNNLLSKCYYQVNAWQLGHCAALYYLLLIFSWFSIHAENPETAASVLLIYINIYWESSLLFWPYSEQILTYTIVMRYIFKFLLSYDNSRGSHYHLLLSLSLLFLFSCELKGNLLSF